MHISLNQCEIFTVCFACWNESECAQSQNNKTQGLSQTFQRPVFIVLKDLLRYYFGLQSSVKQLAMSLKQRNHRPSNWRRKTI